MSVPSISREPLRCLICATPTDKPKGEGEGVLDPLAASLEIVLLLKEVLQVPSSFLETLLVRNEGASPSEWGLSCCPLCMRMGREIEFISRRVKEMIRDYQKIREELRKRVTTATASGPGKGRVKGAFKGPSSNYETIRMEVSKRTNSAMKESLSPSPLWDLEQPSDLNVSEEFNISGPLSRKRVAVGRRGRPSKKCRQEGEKGDEDERPPVLIKVEPLPDPGNDDHDDNLFFHENDDNVMDFLDNEDESYAETGQDTLNDFALWALRPRKSSDKAGKSCEETEKENSDHDHDNEDSDKEFQQSSSSDDKPSDGDDDEDGDSTFEPSSSRRRKRRGSDKTEQCSGNERTSTEPNEGPSSKIQKQSRKTGYRYPKCPYCGTRMQTRLAMESHILKVHQEMEKPWKCDVCKLSFELLKQALLHIDLKHQEDIQVEEGSASAPVVNPEVAIANADSTEEIVPEEGNEEENKNAPETEAAIKKRDPRSLFYKELLEEEDLNSDVPSPDDSEREEDPKVEERRKKKKINEAKWNAIKKERYLKQREEQKRRDEEALQSFPDGPPPGPLYEENRGRYTKPPDGALSYYCPECLKSFPLSWVRDAHLLRVHHGDNKPFQCDICSRRSFRRVELEEHRKEKHGKAMDDPKRPYKGSFTPIEKRIQELKSESRGRKRKPRKKRVTEQEPPKRKIFTCKKCHLIFKTLTAAEVHLKRVHEALGEKHKCPLPECSRIFLTANGLKLHMEQFHEKHIAQQGGALTCPVEGCTFEARSKGQLDKHVINAHNPEQKWQNMCEICSQTFTHKSYLERHQRRVHSDELGLDPWKCPHCGKHLNSERTLKLHLVSHTKEFAYHCSYCGRGFALEDTMQKHVDIVHLKVKQFKCEECGREFGAIMNYKNHLRVHTGEKPFKCRECGKAFSDKPTYNRHLEIHSDKVHACEDCGREFKVWHSFRLHMKQVHDKDTKKRTTRYYNEQQEDSNSSAANSNSNTGSANPDQGQHETGNDSAVINVKPTLPSFPKFE